MVGALAAYWVVLFQQYRKGRARDRGIMDQRAAVVMPVAKAAVTTGLVVTAIPEITAAAAIPAEATPAAAMEAGVTAAGVAAIEAPLAPVV